jgi:hypothetical protein
MLTQIRLLCILTAVTTRGGVAASLQLLTQFDGRVSTTAIREMQREIDRLYRDVQVPISWHEVSGYQSVGETPRIIFIHFVGDCRPLRLPPVHTVAGIPLAGVSRVDGRMLPLVTVNCDRIAWYLWPAMTGSERVRGDAAFGRALARVLAHELYHCLTGTAKHTHSALFRSDISARVLLSSGLDFGADEVLNLRRALARVPPGRATA